MQLYLNFKKLLESNYISYNVLFLFMITFKLINILCIWMKFKINDLLFNNINI
jgi:hypothetical protein